jgi:dihydroorotate dehydrogenase
MTLLDLAQRCLQLLDPETAHRATIWALRRGLAPRVRASDDPRLAIRLWDRDFPNPIGMAAGFDKDARVPGPLLGLGFGFVEVGTLTPHAQAGNPRPRVFRLPEDGAVINRLGFNNRGAAAAWTALEGWRGAGGTGLVGVNIGKNRDSADAAADYAAAAELLAPAADYLTINVSSPNTPGLRALQGRAELEGLIDGLRAALDGLASVPPLLLKVAPDLDEDGLADIAEVALERRLDGLIATNTTVERPPGLVGGDRMEADRSPGPAPPADRRPHAAHRRGRRRQRRRGLCQDPRRRLTGAALYRVDLPGAGPGRANQGRTRGSPRPGRLRERGRRRRCRSRVSEAAGRARSFRPRVTFNSA